MNQLTPRFRRKGVHGVLGVTYSGYSATVHVFDGTLMICWWYGEGRVGWDGVGGLITFKYTSTHTSCYTTARSSCTCTRTHTHTSCYATARSSCTCTHTHTSCYATARSSCKVKGKAKWTGTQVLVRSWMWLKKCVPHALKNKNSEIINGLIHLPVRIPTTPEGLDPHAALDEKQVLHTFAVWGLD